MVHKPKHKVHSFRGLLGDGGQDEINLEKQNVNLAYRIVKFGLMPKTPGGDNSEFVGKIYREEQTSINTTVNFNLPDLLAAGYINNHTGASYYNLAHVIVFDNILFSRNIYVTMKEGAGSSASCNYYLEIEEVPVGAATLMQLKLGVARKLIGAKMGA